MPLLRAVAEEISQEQLVSGVIEEIIDNEALYALLPFTQVNGKAYVYNRETKLGDSTFLAQNSEITEQASEFKSITTHLKILIGDVDVDKFLDTTMSDVVSQKAIQLAMKAKGMGRRFKDALVNGGIVRPNPNTGTNLTATEVHFEFAGIRKIWKDGLASTSFDWPTPDSLLSSGHPDKTKPSSAGWSDFWKPQVVMMSADNTDVTVAEAKVISTSLTYEKLDELVDAIPDNGVDVLMMRKDTYRAYKALLRASGGITPDQIMISNFGMVPAHDGVPIIINDYLPTLEGIDAKASSTKKNFTEIYALRLNEVDGLHGLYGGSNAGIVVEDIGTVQNKDATRTRMKWYCGLALKSTKSMAILRGVAV